MNDTPRFEHDCDNCTFLGQWFAMDLYHCLQGGVIPTVIARWSSADADYTSGAAFEHTQPWAAVAMDRARTRGLVR